MIAHGTEGRIINISSVGRELEVFALDEVRDLANTDNLILYETSCGGINALTKNLAIELAQHSITVNAIALAREDNEQIHDDGVSMGGYPLEWDPSPRNIGHIVAYLTSARANYITGSIMLAKVEGLDAVEEILAGNDIP
jgi:NAD(P)-dependent dehydrogenase (short-subunit alcohol dehydrogenase family)